MKLVSPLHRGSTCTWRCVGTPAPAARPIFAPRFTPSGLYAARIARNARTCARDSATRSSSERSSNVGTCAIGATIKWPDPYGYKFMTVIVCRVRSSTSASRSSVAAMRLQNTHLVSVRPVSGCETYALRHPAHSRSKLIRLRPPALDRPCDDQPRPGLRSAPGYSCGSDLPPSIARATINHDRASGLRLATHAAPASGPRSPVRRSTTTGPPVCAWLLMRLRPPALDRPCDDQPRPGLRSAPGYSCGSDLRPSIARATINHDRASGLRLATHAAPTS